jgi:hypothetical protein
MDFFHVASTITCTTKRGEHATTPTYKNYNKKINLQAGISMVKG